MKKIPLSTSGICGCKEWGCFYHNLSDLENENENGKEDKNY